MRRENRLNVLASKTLKDIGGKNMLGKQVVTTDMQAAGGMVHVLTQDERHLEGGSKDGGICSKPDESHEPPRGATVQGGSPAQDRRPASAAASPEEARHESQGSASPSVPPVHPRFKLVEKFRFRTAAAQATRDRSADRAEIRALLARLVVRLYSDRQKNVKKVAA